MPSSSDELPVGRIAGAFGIQGELKCDPTSAGRTLFSTGARFRLVLSNGTSQNVELQNVREHKNRLLIRLEGVNDATAAQTYNGATFFADRGRIVLEPGEYLDRDLAGCELFDPAGKRLGTVSRVEHYPSSDMLIVRGKMVPMVKEFIKRIDVEAGRIDVDLPAGLIDDSEAEEA